MENQNAVQQIEQLILGFLKDNLKNQTHNVGGYEFKINEINEFYLGEFKPPLDPTKIITEGPQQYHVDFGLLITIPDKIHDTTQRKNAQGWALKLIIKWEVNSFQVDSCEPAPLIYKI